jgi:hypothetical protein
MSVVAASAGAACDGHVPILRNSRSTSGAPGATACLLLRRETRSSLRLSLRWATRPSSRNSAAATAFCGGIGGADSERRELVEEALNLLQVGKRGRVG